MTQVRVPIPQVKLSDANASVEMVVTGAKRIWDHPMA
jgi:hypothetical protein